MKDFLFSLLTILVLALTQCSSDNTYEEDQRHEDSLSHVGYYMAIDDFDHNRVYISESSLGMNTDYAEEVFYQECGLKVNIMRNGQIRCGTPFVNDPRHTVGYKRAVDSLFERVLGMNFYERVKRKADSLKSLYSDRYSREYITWRAEYIKGEDSLNEQLKRIAVYPNHSISDNVSGSIRVIMQIDTAGNVSGARIHSGIRRDLDSVALSGCLKLGRFYPAFRWGRPQDSEMGVDVVFSLKD